MKYIIGLITLLLLAGGAYWYASGPQMGQKVGSASLDGTCAKAKNLSSTDEVFKCVLNDGTSVSGFAMVGFWSHTFQVKHLDASGNVLNIFSKEDDSAPSGGEFEVSDIKDGIFHIYHHVLDECYDATFTFTFDLNTGKYSEDQKGGERQDC